MRVQLEDRGGAGGGERALDRRRDRVGLRRTGGDQEQVAGAEDGAEALGEDVVGDLVERAEEPRVVAPRLLGQRLDPGGRGQRRAGLVEGQVAVAADAEDLEVDAAGLGELRLVGGAGGRHVGRVGAVHAVGGQAQVVGQLAGDGGPVGLRMAGRQADVLVEQERPHLVVRRPGAGPVARDQLGVRRHGGRAGGQPQHGRRAGADQCLDGVRGERGHLGGGGERDDLHYERPSSAAPIAATG